MSTLTQHWGAENSPLMQLEEPFLLLSLIYRPRPIHSIDQGRDTTMARIKALL